MKNKRVWIRMSDEEYDILHARAQVKYNSVSEMIRAALKQLDDVQAKDKFRVMRDYVELYERQNYELNRIGNNLNQVVHNINLLAQQNLLSEDHLVKNIRGLIIELDDTIGKMLHEQQLLKKVLTKI